MRTHEEMTFIYQALRIAEHAHRTRRRGLQYRKGPAGSGRPASSACSTRAAVDLPTATLPATPMMNGTGRSGL